MRVSTESEKRQFLIFIGVLAAIALVITAWFVEIHISRQDAAIAKKAAEDVAAQDAAHQAADEKAQADRTAKAREEAVANHSADLARYLNGTVSKKPGIASVAVAVASEDGALNRHIGEALARKFQGKAVEMFPSLFTSEFLSDGLFSDTFSGSRAALARLDLLNSLDGLVLGHETVEYSQNPSEDNTFTAHLKIDVTTMPTATTGNGETWTLSANGVGFHRDDARSMAEDRVIKQIAADTNMVLNLNSSGNH
jgi:hypothetical protein